MSKKINISIVGTGLMGLQHIKAIQPDVDLNVSVTLEDGSVEDVDLPIGVTFFWPDASV